MLDDISRAVAERLEQRAIDAGRGGSQIEADEKAAERGIPEGDPTTVPPVERHEPVLAGRELSGGGVVSGEIAVRIWCFGKGSNEPVQRVAEGRLTGFVAPKPRQRAILGHALDPLGQRTRAIVEKQKCGRRSKGADERARFDRSDRRHDDVGVDDRNGDHGVTENAGALAP